MRSITKQAKKISYCNQISRQSRDLPNTSITNDANSHTSRETSEATSKARREMSISIKKIIGFCFRVNTGTDNHSNDQTVYTQNSSHNNRNYGFHHEFWSHHTHRCNANSTLRGTVRSSHACTTTQSKHQTHALVNKKTIRVLILVDLDQNGNWELEFAFKIK